MTVIFCDVARDHAIMWMWQNMTKTTPWKERAIHQSLSIRYNLFFSGTHSSCFHQQIAVLKNFNSLLMVLQLWDMFKPPFLSTGHFEAVLLGEMELFSHSLNLEVSFFVNIRFLVNALYPPSHFTPLNNIARELQDNP